MKEISLTRIQFKHEPDADDPGLPMHREGVTFTFASGYKLSIQCGSINYCTRTEPHGAADAEIAVIAPSGGWATRQIVAGALGEELEDDVREQTTVEEIAKIMAHLEAWIP